MDLITLQKMQAKFEEERGWDKFPSSLIYIHLTEELSEIGRHILFEEGYKVRGLGHQPRLNLEDEFGQVLSLLLQLANRFHIDLEGAYLKEVKMMEKRFNRGKWRRYMEGYKRRVCKAEG